MYCYGMYGMVVSGDHAVYQSVDYLPILWRFRMYVEYIDLIHKQFYKILIDIKMNEYKNTQIADEVLMICLNEYISWLIGKLNLVG